MKRMPVAVALAVVCTSIAATASLPRPWFLAGSNPRAYVAGIDENGLLLASRVKDTAGFGTIMQTIDAAKYAGKRVRLSATVRSEDVSQWAGVWMRVDGPDRRAIAFDNMQNRPIRGTTDAHTVDVVLNVPRESVSISLGILLDGPGKVWMDKVKLEEAPGVMVTGSGG